MIEIPPITPVVIEHRLQRLVCPCCSTSTCATLPADVEATRSGHKLSALVGLLGSRGRGAIGDGVWNCRSIAESQTFAIAEAWEVITDSPAARGRWSGKCEGWEGSLNIHKIGYLGAARNSAKP